VPGVVFSFWQQYSKNTWFIQLLSLALLLPVMAELEA
jgi:hypothetical protein